MVCGAGGGLDDPTDQPLHGPFDLHALDAKPAHDVEKVVSQDAHFQTGMIGSG